MVTPPDDVGTVLPDDVPVEMPQLPLERVITAAQQFKALGDPTRSRILATHILVVASHPLLLLHIAHA